MKNVNIVLVYFLLSLTIFISQAIAHEIKYPDYLPPRLGAEKIWFIPGWQHTKTPTGEYSQYFEKALKEKVYIYVWKASGSWKEAKLEVTNEAKRLSRKIYDFTETQRNEMVLIGHSLGAKMIVDASQELIDRKIKVKQVVFLGAAVDFDNPKLKQIEMISINPPINIFNREDSVLKNLYGPAENTFACGYIGIGVHLNTLFRQFEVKNSYNDIKTLRTEIKNRSNHLVQQYIETLKMILQGNADESLPSDFEKVNEILNDIGLNIITKISIPPLVPIKIIDKIDYWEYCKLELPELKLSDLKLSGLKEYAIIDPFQRLIYLSDAHDNTDVIWNKLKEKLNK